MALKLVHHQTARHCLKILDEANIIRALSSEYIVNLIDVLAWEGNIFAFYELMEGGSMTGLIERGYPYSEQFCKYTIHQVTKGLEFMHENHVIHRDIKADNILVRSDGTIKICDLGLSIYQEDDCVQDRSIMGTPNWIAPEILQG